MTPKQIEFFRNDFTKLAIFLFLFAPMVSLISFPLFYGLGKIINLNNYIALTIAATIPIALLSTSLFNRVYRSVLDVLEEERMPFIKALKLAIKRSFCSHLSWEAKYEENPSPCHFLEVKAKCSKCGAQTYEINKRAHEIYKLQLADLVLFQRNAEKFPEYYKNAYGYQEMQLKERSQETRG